MNVDRKTFSYKIKDNDLGQLTPSIRNAINFLKTQKMNSPCLVKNIVKSFQ